MPPKPKKKDNNDGVIGEDPQIFLQNYKRYSNLIGVPIHPQIVRTLTDEEKYPVEQIIIDEENGPLGPGGTRALMTAMMGTAPSMNGIGYYLIKSLRFWRSNIQDEGVNSICEILRLGGSEIKLSYLELLDCNLTYRSGIALGTSLSRGNNLSLLTLKLDFNSGFGSAGLHQLCLGLRTNISLRQLHLQFCNITSESGEDLAELLSNTNSLLEVLNLTGNRLRGPGLSSLCHGLVVNTKLKELYLADNLIDQEPDDLQGLSDLKDCLLQPNLALTYIDLMYNRIGAIGGQILLPIIENIKIKDFLVDLTVPKEIFEKLFRRSTGGKKKKKGKGKKGFLLF